MRDFPAPGGIFWALPSVTPASGAIVVQSTRYGSLCRFEVTGAAQTQGSRVVLHVSFAERLALCTADIRALTYTATVGASAGEHEVLVVHDDGVRTDTLVRRTVEVK